MKDDKRWNLWGLWKRWKPKRKAKEFTRCATYRGM